MNGIEIFSFQQIVYFEIEKHIRNTDSSKAIQENDISTKQLKENFDII